MKLRSVLLLSLTGLTITMAGALTGCGQSGPLVQPKPPTVPPASPAEPKRGTGEPRR